MTPDPPEMKPSLLEHLAALEQSSAPLDRALAAIIEHFGADSGTLHGLRDGQLELRAHSAGLPPQVLALIQTIPVGKGMAGLAVERGAPVTACNLQTDATGDVRPGARATGLKGSIVVPVLRGDEPLGALGIANVAERDFSAEEVALLLAAGRALAGWLGQDGRAG